MDNGMEIIMSPYYEKPSFWLMEQPSSAGPYEAALLQTLENTVQKLENRKKVLITSFIQNSEFTWVYGGFFEGIAVIIKVAPRYDIGESITTAMEDILSDLLGDVIFENNNHNWDDQEWMNHYQSFVVALDQERRLIYENTLRQNLAEHATAKPFTPLRFEPMIHKEIIAAISTPHEAAVIPKFLESDSDIVKPFDYYIVQRLGRSLREDASPSLKVVARDIITALRVLNRAKIFHGDVHPGNIVNREGGVALIDFGISQRYGYIPGDEIVDPGLSKEVLKVAAFPKFVGNPTYAPPSQYFGIMSYVGDLISLCYILDIMGTGISLPWAGKDMITSYNQKLNYRPRTPKVSRLYEYLLSIEGFNNPESLTTSGPSPDYDICLSFFS